MIYSIMEKMGSCINDSQWKIGAFLTNSYANPKKFRSRKKKIHFGLNQQPDCVVIPNPDRKSSVILEANRSQIPIASLLDSTIPWESYKRITYPIPANDTIQFIYLFRHSITKTVILERPRITAIQGAGARAFSTAGSGGRKHYASASGNKYKYKATFIHLFWMKILLLLPRVPLGLLCLFCRIPTSILSLFFFILSLFFCVESAAAATGGDIVMAHPPGSSGYTTNTLVDALMDTTSASASSGEPSVNQPTPEFHPVEQEAPMDALMDTTSARASSGEPSVNQPTPEFLPVQQEVEQQALLTEIREVLQQEYRRYIIRSSPWMRNTGYLYSPNITRVAELMIKDLELDLSSIEELQQFLQDIGANPQQLNSEFFNYWGRRA